MEGFKSFAVKRIIIGVILVVSILWIIGAATGFFEKTEYAGVPMKPAAESVDAPDSHTDGEPADILQMKTDDIDLHPVPHPAESEKVAEHSVTLPEKVFEHSVAPPEKVFEHPAAPPERVPEHLAVPAGGDLYGVPSRGSNVTGIEFVAAVIRPLAYELDQRFWGWRPNDILDFTDNINHFQLGVLEVTRRTAVVLAERISRTGASVSFDENLERAMNWFMVKPERYWFPAPESKYRAGLEEFALYMEKLKKGEASFYNRTDNLLPLLKTYQNLLGSCDENLVKQKEDDGSEVSFFKSDDYFFYAKGVASALLIILEAVEKDFYGILYSRNSLDGLHHAILMCRMASELDPWVITDSDFAGVLANHRANMAASISHARFYLGVIIRTLST